MKKGQVIKSTGSWHIVKLEDNSVWECRIKGKLRTYGFKSTNPVAVGDWVDVEIIEGDTSGMITNLYDRKNYIIRRSSNLSKTSHIIAANIDQAYLMVTITCPETYTEFMDRFLVTAEAYEIPAILIFNKIDLYNTEHQKKLFEWKEIYEKIGYTCFVTSAITYEGIEPVKERMKNKINLMAGNSGVGKSALINAIDSTLHLKVDEISTYHKKGKHTTTFAEMLPLSFGGYIIDTPGIKGFGIIDIPKEEMYHHFRELFALSKHCQYYNCTHTHEPGCAVIKALEKNEISNSRYRNYINMFYKVDKKYRV